MALAFFSRQNTPHFCHSVACQKQTDNNNCCLPQPTHRIQNTISMKNFKNILIKYLDYMYKLRKATRGVDFRSVMSFAHFFSIYYYLTFNIVLWHSRHSWEVSAVTRFHECCYEFQIIEINYLKKITINIMKPTRRPGVGLVPETGMY